MQVKRSVVFCLHPTVVITPLHVLSPGPAVTSGTLQRSGLFSDKSSRRRVLPDLDCLSLLALQSNHLFFLTAFIERSFFHFVYSHHLLCLQWSRRFGNLHSLYLCEQRWDISSFPDSKDDRFIVESMVVLNMNRTLNPLSLVSGLCTNAKIVTLTVSSNRLDDAKAPLRVCV